MSSNSSSFIDNNVRPGNTYYYRLKQIDFDGRFELSELRSAELKSNAPTITIGPNPTSQMVYIEIENNINEYCQISLFNRNGEQVKSNTFNLEDGSNRLAMNIDNLATGMYFLKTRIGEDSFYEQIIVH